MKVTCQNQLGNSFTYIPYRVLTLRRTIKPCSCRNTILTLAVSAVPCGQPMDPTGQSQVREGRGEARSDNSSHMISAGRSFDWMTD